MSLNEHIDEREIYWIKELNSLAPHGYNLGTGGHYEREYTQEQRIICEMLRLNQKLRKMDI
jgi:hypothetical protein